MSDDLLLYAVGDIAPEREDPISIFDNVKTTFKAGDIVFGQLETNLTKRGTPLPHVRHARRGSPKIAKALKDAGFTVVSFASNHCMDLGQEAFFDTLDALKSQDLLTIGVGKNIEEARKPAIIECKGTKIAFLAYNTILPRGYWADIDRPGSNPLRAFTFYEQVEHDQPGTPCRIHTFPHKDDLDAMRNSIVKAKEKADIVIVSMHFGIHFIPAVIADYQREVAHTAIDCGADLILGHHAHILKGIEVYAGKVIFYSLCNFAYELTATKEEIESPRRKEIAHLNPDWVPDPEYPHYFLPRDCRKTIIAKCTISNKKIDKVSFLPVYINKKAEPEILDISDERFYDVTNYIKQITTDQKINTNFCIDGNEVIIK
ncbi:MAG: CapA family protein [Firmicutes bacterium]|nr:CapA family protein [Bacillota bacterium]